ncbi:MAG TPA: MFS transporter [Candidatus Thermoplasmatota archaeon]|nr:MFS transporter [Candidatus Thermoplasmatota archaeon]
MSATAPATPTAHASLSSFTRQFWVINGVELLERAAWYGALAVFAIHLNQLGFTDEQIGGIAALLLPLPYIVPLLSSPLSEKFGYRPALALAFVLYGIGLGILASSTSVEGILAAVILWGVGAGLFKPIPVATIGHITRPETRNRAFAIFYWAINLGAFAGPLVIGLYFGNYLQAFAFTGAVIGLSLVLTLLAYRNPQPPQRDVDALRQFRKLAEILVDRPYVLLVAIYSGFWFLYAMNFTFLLRYLQDFVALPDGFNVPLFQAINPLVIILTGGGILVLSLLLPSRKTLQDRMAPIALMTVGIAVYSVGVMTLGFSNVFALAVVGVIIYTIGEYITHPGFLSYVSKIAPADRQSVYQSFGFLPIALGFFTGPLVGGILYGALATRAGQPRLFWAIIAAVGLLTIVAFQMYNRRYVSREEPIPGEAPAPVRRAPATNVFAGRAAMGGVLLLVPVLLAAGAFSGTTPFVSRGADGDDLPPGDLRLTTLSLRAIEDYTAEGRASRVEVSLPEEASGNVSFRLRWRDEPPGAFPGSQNAPDTFRLRVTDPSGATFESEPRANPPAGEGTIVLTLPPQERAGGTYAVEIAAEACGDTALSGGLGPALAPDNGNAWALETTYQAPAPMEETA